MLVTRSGPRGPLGWAALALVASGGALAGSTVSGKLREAREAGLVAETLRARSLEQERAVHALQARVEELEAAERSEERRSADAWARIDEVLRETEGALHATQGELRATESEIERLRAHDVAQTAQQVAAVEARVQLLREFADREQLEANARRIDLRIVHRELLEPTVRVNAKSEVGSGSIVYSRKRGGKVRTFVLTAWHIVKDNLTDGKPEPIEVDVYDAQGAERDTKSKLVARHEALDLALLEIENEKAPSPTAKLPRLPDLERAALFSKVYAIGCPLGYAPLETSGDLTSLKKELDGISYWMTNAPTIFGNSGGGIYLAETRQLVGVLSRISAYKNLIDVAVPHMGIVTPITLVYDWLDATEFAFVHKEGIEPETPVLDAAQVKGR